jgi:hypothetical protein
MKRFIVISFLALTIFSCKNDKESKEENAIINKIKEDVLPEGQQLLRGEFIYLSDAAVLTTRNEIYAVQIDKKMHELNEVAKALKKTEFDMVHVVIHGSLSTNPLKEKLGEGWDQMVTVTKIIEVSPATSANLITTGRTIDIKDVK